MDGRQVDLGHLAQALREGASRYGRRCALALAAVTCAGLCAALATAGHIHLQHWWAWRTGRRRFYLLYALMTVVGHFVVKRRLRLTTRASLATPAVSATLAFILSRLLPRAPSVASQLPVAPLSPIPADMRRRSASVHVLRGADGRHEGVSMANEMSAALEEKIPRGELDDPSILRGLLALSFFRKNAGRSLFEAVLAAVRAQALTFTAGQVVFREGETSEGLLIVHKGKLGLVKAESVQGDAQAVSEQDCLGVLGTGDSVGDLDIVRHSPTRAMTCVALTDASVCLIPHSMFMDIWTRRPDVLLSYIQGSLGHLWRISSYVLETFFHLDVPRFQQPHLHSDQLKALYNSSKGYGSTDIRSMTRPYKAGARIFQAGDVCQHLYIVLEGSLALTLPSGEVSEHRRGDIVGSTPFFGDVPFSKTARAGDAGATVAALTREDLVTLGGKHNAAIASLLLSAVHTLTGVIQEFSKLGLQRVWLRAAQPMFQRGENVSQLFIVVCGRVRIMKEDVHDQAQGKDGEGGEDDNQEEEHAGRGFRWGPERQDDMSEVGRGGTVGDVCMFMNHRAHVNTAICIRDTEAVRISKGVFSRICRLHPAAMLKYSRVMAKQLCSIALHSTHVINSSHLAVFCVFPAAGTAQLDLATFASNVAKALGEVGPTLLVDRSTVNEVLSSDTPTHPHHFAPAGRRGSSAATPAWDVPNARRVPASEGMALLEDFVELARLKAWLTRQQDTHQFVVLQADPWMSPWTNLCVDNADRVLVVASPHASPKVGQVEQCLLWSPMLRGTRLESHHHLHERWLVGKELVMLHKQLHTTPLPQGTRRWLQERPRITRHHHVRRDVDADYARLARHLTGRAVGLVLGGGGARGLAHLGVLQAMEDANVPVDFICGTSQGSIIAASYATCLSATKTRDMSHLICYGLGTIRNLLRDVTLPVLSYFNGEKFSWLIRRTLGRDTMIEDLWINFFCVATNVSKVDAKICESGCLWESVRASMTIVGLVPPMFTDEGLMVDGGYVDNLPAEHMRRRIGSGLCIAADVENKDKSAFTEITPYHDGTVSGSWIVAYWLMNALMAVPCAVLGMRTPYEYRVPSYTKVVENLTFLTHEIQFRRAIHNVDYYIRPPIERFSLLDYALKDEIAKVGYDFTARELRKWQAEARHHMASKHAKKLAPRSSTPQTGMGRHPRSLLSLFIYETQMKDHGDNDNSVSAAISPLLTYRDNIRTLGHATQNTPQSTTSLLERSRSVPLFATNQRDEDEGSD